MTTCPICQESFKNSYLMAKHKAAEHPEKFVEEAGQQETIKESPKSTVLVFKKPIRVQINNLIFEGTSVEVPFEYVDAVLSTAREAYGPDII